jgi:hypothetical protein
VIEKSAEMVRGGTEVSQCTSCTPSARLCDDLPGRLLMMVMLMNVSIDGLDVQSPVNNSVEKVKDKK